MNCKTKDMGNAVLLLTLGNKIMSTEKRNDGMYFEFNITMDEFNDIFLKYINHELEVDPKKYFDNLSLIKSYIYQ